MKISIITVTYNSAGTLPATLQCVRSQTCRDVEHILIDGASTDGTLQQIQAYAAQRPGTVYLSERDTGIYNAVNKGIRLATGEIIGVLNSDDVLADSTVLQTIVDTFERTGAQAVYGDLLYCRGEHVVRYWKSNPFVPSALKYGWMPAHPTFYCRREVYEALGLYDEQLRISADYDFMLRVLCGGCRVAYIPRVLVRMQVGGVSNRSLRTMWKKSCEDAVALRHNDMGCGWLTVFAKNIRKMAQFLR